MVKLILSVTKKKYLSKDGTKMSKRTRIVVAQRQGLPNYSHREASVELVADEDESLNVVKEIRKLQAEIREAWGEAKTSSDVSKTSTPQEVPQTKAAKGKAQAALAKDDLGLL